MEEENLRLTLYDRARLGSRLLGQNHTSRVVIKERFMSAHHSCSQSICHLLQSQSCLTFAGRYINDIDGTRKSLTDDGFFKTGDIAEKVGDRYFLKGRISVDSKYTEDQDQT
jgi:hypothetical protein